MDSNAISTQRTNQESEASRLSQDHNQKIRKLKAEQEAELEAMTSKFERDKADMDKAYKVELSAKKNEIDNSLSDTTSRHQAMMTDLARRNDAQSKMAQETYRLQQDQFRVQSEGKLNKLREQEVDATANIERKASKGNA